MKLKHVWLLCALFLFGSSGVQAQNVEAVRKSLKAYQGHVYGSGRRYDSKQEKWVAEPKALREPQIPMYDAIADYVTERQGVGKGLEGYIIAPTGTGKTVIYAKVVEGMVMSSTSKVLIVVPSLNLVTQTYDELMAFTNIAQKDIGLVHTGKKEFGRRVTITTYSAGRVAKSLIRKTTMQ